MSYNSKLIYSKSPFIVVKDGNPRYFHCEYYPKIIERMYLSGNFFKFKPDENSNYKNKVNKLSKSSQLINEEYKNYKLSISNLFKENENMQYNLKKEYKNLHSELKDKCNEIEKEIKIGFTNQKKENVIFKKNIADVGFEFNNLKKLCEDIRIRINKLRENTGEC